MSQTAEFDTLIVNGRVVDGTGNPWFYGDVALAGDRIAAVVPRGAIERNQAREVIDAGGLVVCPGFIDIQSHSIVPLLGDSRSLSKVAQGVTTEIMGESWTPAPVGGRIAESFDEADRAEAGPSFDDWVEQSRGWTRFGDWLRAIERRGTAVNVGSFIGGGTVREFGKGTEMGDASPAELDAMRTMLADAMADGAFGIATALIYSPGSYAGTEELITLCEVVAKYHGVHITHMRSEEERLFEALDETIEIARRTGVATEIYHLKAAGRENWHKMPEVIARINAARAAGIDITADMYPYPASGTGLSSCLPGWADEDSKLYERLSDPEMRAKIRHEMHHPTGEWVQMGTSVGPENILLAGLQQPETRQYRGRRLAEVAAERGQDWADTVLDLLTIEQQRIFTIYFSMNEENLKLQLRQPWIKISTDAGGIDPATAAEHGPSHPRAYGTYPRVLAKYVREEGLLTLEDAIRKMTSAVADRLHLRQRGLLRAGCYADIVVFDPDTIADNATFEQPHQLATGIHDVWVNGIMVFRDGEHTGTTPGRRLVGPGTAAD